MDRLLKYVKDISRAKFFDIQNVADYFWTYPEDEWTLNQFTVAPPFDFFAMRYTLPDSPPDEFKGEVLVVFRVTQKAPSLMMKIMAPSDVELNPYDPTIVPDAKWHLDILTFAAFKRQVSAPVRWFLAVKENGQGADYLGYPAFWVIGSDNEARINIIPNTFLQVSLFALTFLHCKNVEIIDPPPASRKRLPRKRKFESRYYRLKVNAMGSEKRRKDVGQKTGIRQSLHIVRGHFREYGPEYGKGKLFGRYSGRYWVAAHTKGDKDLGTIDKDYEVK